MDQSISSAYNNYVLKHMHYDISPNIILFYTDYSFVLDKPGYGIFIEFSQSRRFFFFWGGVLDIRLHLFSPK